MFIVGRFTWNNGQLLFHASREVMLATLIVGQAAND